MTARREDQSVECGITEGTFFGGFALERTSSATPRGGCTSFVIRFGSKSSSLREDEELQKLGHRISLQHSAYLENIRTVQHQCQLGRLRGILNWSPDCQVRLTTYGIPWTTPTFFVQPYSVLRKFIDTAFASSQMSIRLLEKRKPMPRERPIFCRNGRSKDSGGC